MKVLINVPDLTCPGGVSKYFQTVNGKFTIPVEYLTIGSRFNSKGFRLQWWRMLHDYFYFLKKIKNEKFEVIHLNPSLGFKAVVRDSIFLLLTRLSRSKVIVFWHGWNDDFYNQINRRAITTYLFRRIFFKSDAFIVLANDIKEKFINLGYKKPIFIETTLIDEKEISPEMNHNLLDQKNIKENVNILFLSTVSKGKGIYDAVRGYKIVKENFNNVTLQIAGDGPELENIKSLVYKEKIQDVTFSGYLIGKQKINAFLNADIYVFPSFSEGMPISILEAMASGLPIITTRVGGIKDFFINGKMGFSIKIGNPQELAESLKILINNKKLRREISLFNYNYARSRFLASQVLTRLESIYSKISVSEKI